MRTSIGFVLAMFSTSVVSESRASNTLVSPPTGETRQLSDSQVPRPKYYDETSSRANWVVDRWNIAEELPALKEGETRNACSPVKWEPHDRCLLEQDGIGSSCDRVYMSGVKDVHEFDLFMGAINRNSPDNPQSALGAPTTLDRIGRLEHRISVDPAKREFIDSSCRVTHAVLITSVTLGNLQAHQTRFYPLRLSLWQPSGQRPTEILPKPSWFAKGSGNRTNHKGDLGYDDCVSGCGGAPAVSGAHTGYALDRMRRLVPIIREGAAYEMDQDLSHGSVAGTYHGPMGPCPPEFRLERVYDKG